jgi:hypothetical protein
MADHRDVGRRPPLGALVALVAVLALGPVGLLVFGHRAGAAAPAAKADGTLAAIARAGGCRLIEYAQLQRTDPTTGGRVTNERITARPGSYVGRRPPGARGMLHALMHGAVLVAYQPATIPPAQQRALGTLAAGPRSRTIVFADATMHPPVAATAYLAMLTCPRADPPALRALRAFRDRRHDFGQGF